MHRPRSTSPVLHLALSLPPHSDVFNVRRDERATHCTTQVLRSPFRCACRMSLAQGYMVVRFAFEAFERSSIAERWAAVEGGRGALVTAGATSRVRVSRALGEATTCVRWPLRHLAPAPQVCTTRSSRCAMAKSASSTSRTEGRPRQAPPQRRPTAPGGALASVVAFRPLRGA